MSKGYVISKVKSGRYSANGPGVQDMEIHTDQAGQHMLLMALTWAFKEGERSKAKEVAKLINGSLYASDEERLQSKDDEIQMLRDKVNALEVAGAITRMEMAKGG